MEGSSSGNNGSGDPDFGMFCFCGELTPLRTSGTQKNLGRRFFRCANYKNQHLEDCGFFCWYESSILQGRADLRPMMVQTKKKAVRTVQQCESSASMTSEEMQRTTITMQMKIEAMQKEFDAMQMRVRNGGKMNWNYLWIVVFCVLSYMCGKSSQCSVSIQPFWPYRYQCPASSLGLRCFYFDCLEPRTLPTSL